MGGITKEPFPTDDECQATTKAHHSAHSDQMRVKTKAKMHEEALAIRRVFSLVDMNQKTKGSLTLAMGKCLWFSVKLKACQASLSSP